MKRKCGDPETMISDPEYSPVSLAVNQNNTKGGEWKYEARVERGIL